MVTRDKLTELDALSPFELIAELGGLAARSGHELIDTGKGQPNWLATTPRHAYHLLGRFALDEAETDATHADAGWSPDETGAAERLAAFLDKNAEDPGATLLGQVVELGEKELGFAADAWVGELVVGILGCRYPTPHRMLAQIEQLMRRYVVATHFAGDHTTQDLRLFATEGGAAGMCYVLQGLRRNGLLNHGDRIALGVPIFTPYLEMPTLEEFGFDQVFIRAERELDWRYPVSELEQLKDPSIKAFFLVNPGNPGTRALSREEAATLNDIVTNHRPDLIVLTDTAYANFMPGFQSLLATLPRNTIAVHSFSKSFGVTGARLAFIAMHSEHVTDDLLGKQTDADHARLAERYRTVTDKTNEFLFLDRVAAESRDVALYHIVGLSTPQQVQMALMAGFALLNDGQAYFTMTQDVILGRMHSLLDPLGVEVPGKGDTHYYTLLDVIELAKERHGQDFAMWLLAEEHPLAFPVGLAEHYGIVTLPGRGFEANSWNVRVSLANQPDAAYPKIAQAVQGMLDLLHEEYGKKQGAPSR
jgi:aspartate 4-decarboxylase